MLACDIGARDSHSEAVARASKRCALIGTIRAIRCFPDPGFGRVRPIKQRLIRGCPVRTIGVSPYVSLYLPFAPSTGRKDHPEWRDVQPFSAALDGDLKALTASGEQGMLRRSGTSVAGGKNF